MITSLNTVAKIHAAFRLGELTPRELLDHCFANIDRREEKVRAWVNIDREGAIALAESQGQWLLKRAESEALPPLFGIPLGIKDIVDVAGWPTQAGSPLRAKHIAEHDAQLVARLREAGAIILGKTVTTEFACFDPSVTHNPWHLSHTPGGSSSGSAAAVASGMCVAAVGSQTGGSILRPASFCGVVGFKPTHGEVPLAGVVPVAPSLDHAGPIAQSVADAARVFGVMAGSSASASHSFAEDTPIRFGVIRTFFCDQAEAETAAVFGAVMVHLENGLGPVEEVELEVDFADIHRAHRSIMAYECAAYHRGSFTHHRDQYSEHVARLIEDGIHTSAAAYAQALSRALHFRDTIRQLFKSYDVLAMPTTPGPAPGMETTGDPRWQSPWSLSGLPAISIPCGFATLNLPLGLQLVADDDSRLLHIAAQCEEQLDMADEIERLLG